MTLRKIRRSQAISPFGVGAILDIVGESFVAEDISRWRGEPRYLDAPRIAAAFRVEGLRTPPASQDRASDPGVPYMRFPRWLFCGSCRRMRRWDWRDEERGRPPRCNQCTRRSQLVPMRFVRVCGNGHLDDVDWEWWAHSEAHSRNSRQCGEKRLSFEFVAEVGGGLDSLRVRCEACGARRALQGITSSSVVKQAGLNRCRGRQPWQSATEQRGAEQCDKDAMVVQRGASNVYFPLVSSAIDIPPYSDWTWYGSPKAALLNNSYFKLLLAEPTSPMVDGLRAMVASQTGMPVGEAQRAQAAQLGVTAVDDGEAGLTREEYHALCAPPTERDARDRFIATPTGLHEPRRYGVLQTVAADMLPLLDEVVIVNRLREVRILRGFQRYTADRLVPPDLGAGIDWLPAIEVYGEGVFIRFAEEPVARWATAEQVRRRATDLATRLGGSWLARLFGDPVTPRLILLHTVAHILMRQLSFEAGYSSSSLRERIYCAEPDTGEPMAGILIYTAAGDAEGTLGGLARLGEPERLVPVLANALRTAQWCSLDPVCRESTAQGPDGLSMAACHACTLASETSCTHANVLLDRMTLVDESYGYFAGPLRTLLAAQVELTT